MLPYQGGADLVVVVAKGGGLYADIGGQRLPSNCNQLEESQRGLGQQPNTALDNMAKPEGTIDDIAAAAYGQRVMNQLGDEERIAGRFAGDRGRYPIPIFVRPLPQQSRREIARIVWSQIFHP